MFVQGLHESGTSYHGNGIVFIATANLLLHLALISGERPKIGVGGACVRNAEEKQTQSLPNKMENLSG